MILTAHAHTDAAPIEPAQLGGLTAPFVLDGPMDGDAFHALVSQVLAPELTAGEVVVVDNLPARKVRGVRRAIEAAGAGVWKDRRTRREVPCKMVPDVEQLTHRVLAAGDAVVTAARPGAARATR